MKKVLLFSAIFIILILICYGESRKFFCISNGKCVTVWKTYDNVCYVVPGEYYGILKPSSDSYIQTTNGVNLDIIWQKNSNDIIVNSEDDSISIIHNTSPKSIGIVNYNSQKKYNDSLFTNFDGKYHRYKKNIDYISIFIHEDYATDKNGKKL